MRSIVPILVALLAAPAVAQTTDPAAAPAPAARSQEGPASAVPPTSLDIQVTITRMNGDTVVSRLPYSLEVTTDTGESRLNMGAEVPVPTTTMAPVPGGRPGPPAGAAGDTAPSPPAPRPPAMPMQGLAYRPVGTVITCAAWPRGDRYLVSLQVDDTSVVPGDDAARPGRSDATGLPVFRSFRSRNSLLLRDGQSRQFTAAADHVSGEVVRVDVTLRVVK